MNRIFFFVIIVTLLVHNVCSQPDCGYSYLLQNRVGIDTSLGHIWNGGVFTPKGDLRILIVFVTFDDPYDTCSLDGWPLSSRFPNWALNSNQKPFYNSFSEFSPNIFENTNRLSLSNFYYQMSNGALRIIADYYPDTIMIKPKQNTGWGRLNRMAARRLSESINWSLYDNRVNRPNFISDNSTYNPDNRIDYVVFCYRFSWKWPVPDSWFINNEYNANGFAGTEIRGDVATGNNFFISDEGFTLITGAMNPIEIFPHEIGHDLYRGPHYNGCNGVAGKYFYMPAAGWGMMDIKRNYVCALGWERYVLNWIPYITANTIPADIEDVSDLAVSNGVYTLRDFITTGDALRIRVPAMDGTYQYLWLENHQGLSTFDGTLHRGVFCGDLTEEFKKGLVAYVEEFSHVKNEDTIAIYTQGNAIRWLSKNGDYDFSYTSTPDYPNVLCTFNVTYPIYTEKANSLSGQCVNDFIRNDYDNNGIIEYNSSHIRATNEKTWAVEVDDKTPTARWITGTGLQFHEGDKVGIATNPTIKNMPEYNANTYTMGDYYLNGISFEVLSENADGSMTVKIRLDDVAVDRDVRWVAASIVLGDITGDNRPDVDVQPNIKLTIDMSGTPNRHANPDNPNQTTSVLEDFITPTRFACRNGAFFKQEPYSVVEVKNGSTLVLENASVYEVGDHASLTIEPSATLVVKSGATLRVLGSGHVEVADLAYICVEDGAYIDLVDTVSAVNLMPLAVQGTYSYGNVPQCTCTLTDITEYPLAHGSNGGIYQCSTDRIISSTTYTHDAYECGLNIRAGRISDGMTRPRDVVIDNGTRVVMDAAQSVRLEPGFKVNAGGRLEVR